MHQNSNIYRLKNANFSYSPMFLAIKQYAHTVRYKVEINFIPIDSS